jgi:membrane protein YdbS with pleckstrin-like domain
MYQVSSKNKTNQLQLIRMLPSFLYLLIALAAGYGLFRGDAVRYSIPIFLIVTRFNFVLYAKYKLENWWLHVLHALMALLVIFFMF